MKLSVEIFEFVPPSPTRIAVSALGMATAGLPSVSPHADARVTALLGVVAMLATVVVGRSGVVTFGCAAAMTATTFASLHGAPSILPIGVSLLLLSYLLVSDFASARGELHGRLRSVLVARVRLLVFGAGAIVVLSVVTTVDVGGSFLQAIAAMIAAIAAVAAVVAVRARG